MTWWVVVEEQRGSERNWALSERVRFADRETAEAEALRLAREHEPAHPWSVRTRTVLRGPGGYLVIAEGRTATFHFRVSVLEEV